MKPTSDDLASARALVEGARDRVSGIYDQMSESEKRDAGCNVRLQLLGASGHLTDALQRLYKASRDLGYEQ